MCLKVLNFESGKSNEILSKGPFLKNRQNCKTEVLTMNAVISCIEQTRLSRSY